MSTRRARIKAVTSLPPRRKNTDQADTKSKVLVKDEVEKAIKSPRTPRQFVKTTEDTGQASPARIAPLKSPLNVARTPDPEKVPNSQHQFSNTVSQTAFKSINSPKVSEKVSVITNTSSIKSVFLSPQIRSPVKRPNPSPATKNSKVFIEIDVERLIAPERENLKTDIIKLSGETNVINSVTTIANEVQDDYNVPSVPESICEDTIMDGIVPLQPVSKAPKPIALLKNEIISENAEVLFDPIVPLPSPSKIRPKLRPTPRLAPLRRNSVQGSASESEDENRRALLSSGSMTPAPAVARQRNDSHTSHSTLHSLPNREINRMRNDSICSSLSQTTAQPPPVASPVKEKHFPKSRRQEMSRRMAAMRRRRETIKRDKLTMYDLIFYNPITNPIVPDEDELKAKAANKKEEEKKKAEDLEENVDDPPEQDTAAPVPQIKLGPNGEIILDEQSLVIKQSDGNRKVSSVVREGAWGDAGAGAGGRYRRAARTAEWSDAETVRFYRALAALGTDFTLMEPLFPGRTRRDMKLKFKKEERLNSGQVDKALRSATEWDADRLHEEFVQERAAAAARARRDAERLQRERRDERDRRAAATELRVKRSRGSKALESSTLPGTFNPKDVRVTCANDIIERAADNKIMRKKRATKKKDVPCSPSVKPAPDAQLTTSPFATLTLIKNNQAAQQSRASSSDMATILKVNPIPKQPPEQLNNVSEVPQNIETGSLVVLTVNDPNSPTKKMLQTYIAHGSGNLTPISLPATFLNSVVGYMKKGTPKSNVSASSSPQLTSPQLTSPSSVASLNSRTSVTPGVLVNSSPGKRKRLSSYTITQL